MPDVKKGKSVECCICGQTYIKYPSTTNKTCSRACGRKRTSQLNVSKWLTKSCPICGQSFQHQRSVYRKYCSKNCKHIGHGRQLSQQIKKTCAVCDASYYVQPSKQDSKYCSQACCKQDKTAKTAGCLICGQTISIRRKYCSTKCMAIAYQDLMCGENNPNWKEGVSNRLNGVPSHIRAKVLQRDGYKCTKCHTLDWDRKPSLLQIHHKKEYAQGGTNELTNLVTLCFICHLQGEHGFKIKRLMPQAT